MKNLTKIFALGLALAFSTSAYADTIGVGALSFGPTTGNGSGDEYTSNSLTFFGTQGVNGTPTGSLSSFTGAVTVDNIASFTGLTPGTLFFSTTNAGDTLNFYLNSMTSTDVSGVMVDIGTGYFKETGFDETPATVDFSTSGGNGGLSVTAYEASSSITPEPSTLLLLGTGLIGAAGLTRRKFITKFVS